MARLTSVFLCYDLTARITNESIDSINESNSNEVNNIPYGITFDQLRQLGAPYNGEIRIKDGVPIWCLGFYELDIEAPTIEVGEIISLEEYKSMDFDIVEENS